MTKPATAATSATATSTATPAAIDGTKITATSPCPCGSGKTFGECCQPILTKKKPAPTAEALMRSRFTAHVVRDYKHLHTSYAGSVNKPYTEITDDHGDLDWSRLVIHSHEQGTGTAADTAIVEFTAYFLDDEKREHALMEKSAFQRVNGNWLYTRAIRTGPAPIKSTAPKVGRNDPCPCGSGKKYKQCCGK